LPPSRLCAIAACTGSDLHGHGKGAALHKHRDPGEPAEGQLQARFVGIEFQVLELLDAFSQCRDDDHLHLSLDRDGSSVTGRC
jgi:hypothetical protein